MPGSPILDEDARLIAYLETGIYADTRPLGSGRRTSKPATRYGFLGYLFGR